MTTADYKLFTPLTLGKDLTLKNRVVLGPMTRARSDPKTHVPTENNVRYYEQRAGAGLIITEDTTISPQGFGWFGAPGIYTQDQADGWKKVTDAVHAKNGKIFLQLWHMGRQAHSSFNDNIQIVAASPIAVSQGQIRNAHGEHTGFEVPRALETDEIAGVVEDYRKSAELAKQAGFDGVEIHAANGYLIDLFLQSSTNKRTDKYGGSFENRIRFLLEVIEAVKTVWSSDRIGVRLSPNGAGGEMGSQDNADTFTYVLQQLSSLNLAYSELFAPKQLRILAARTQGPSVEEEIEARREAAAAQSEPFAQALDQVEWQDINRLPHSTSRQRLLFHKIKGLRLTGWDLLHGRRGCPHCASPEDDGGSAFHIVWSCPSAQRI